ncbi:alpha/beta hydrolase family protein [Sinosporangium siamense]|nr:alpha/beta hydrolase [Sinosporangium siamense]
MPKPLFRGALAAAVIAIFAATGGAQPAAAAATPSAPVLSKPTGPHRVGMTTLHLVDTSRKDPWVPEAAARELMVSVWYPSRVWHGRRAAYMTAKESELLLRSLGMQNVPPDTLSRTRTNAVADSPAHGRQAGLPLVVLSPGFTAPRSSLTGLAEELASRGYVVAGIDHTYESVGTSFPDGRTTTCVACQSQGSPEFGPKTTKGRAADVAFVLDRLTAAKSAWARLIDSDRVAMVGHSIGGSSASWTMLSDPQVKAGVNMDGYFHVPIPATGLDRPFLLVGEEKTHKPDGTDPTWKRDWANMTGWKRWITVKGTNHMSFTDFPLLMSRLGMPAGSTRPIEITREYVGAFVDKHLKGKPQPILDRPTPRYPEVDFWP